MTVELLIGSAAVVIALIVGATLWSVLSGAKTEEEARGDLAVAVSTGALPPSLHPRIDVAKCMGSGACVAACPESEVLAVLDGRAHVVNPSSCIGHGECMAVCPVDAITLVLGSDVRGVDIPRVNRVFETNVPGIFVVGELGGMGLIYNAMTQALQCMEALIPTLPEPSEGVYSVLIVGAGPAGIAASVAAKAAGVRAVTVDQDTVGGTVLQYPRHKLVMTKPVTLPLYGKLNVGEIAKEELLLIWDDILQKTGVTIEHSTKVDKIERDDAGVFSVFSGDRVFQAHAVVLAMGRRGSPRKLGVPGEELGKVVYRLLEPERYAGTACLVVGGGDSAIEAALALAAAGAIVHLSYRRGDFSRAKKKNIRRVQEAIGSEELIFLPSSQVTEITPTTVALQVDGAQVSILNDFVLIFAGGVLPTSFLRAAGVEIDTYRGEAYAPANR